MLGTKMNWLASPNKASKIGEATFVYLKRKFRLSEEV
jgi:hypothetical protein